MKRVASIAVIGILSLIVASCGSASEPRTTADGKDVVKVGVVPVTDIAPLHLGIEQGYFDEENLEIETVSGKGGPELIAGVTSENLDIGISASTPLVQARANGGTPGYHGPSTG